jgi:hypothetical protein
MKGLNVPAYPKMFFSPREGNTDEILHTESSGGRKNQPGGISPLKDMNIQQDNYGQYDSRIQPQMIENIMQGGMGTPVPQGSFGYQNVKTMRKY